MLILQAESLTPCVLTTMYTDHVYADHVYVSNASPWLGVGHVCWVWVQRVTWLLGVELALVRILGP